MASISRSVEELDTLMAAVEWAVTSGKLISVYARTRRVASNCAERYRDADT